MASPILSLSLVVRDVGDLATLDDGYAIEDEALRPVDAQSRTFATAPIVLGETFSFLPLIEPIDAPRRIAG